MEEKKLRDIISDLEIANKNLHELSQNLDLDEKNKSILSDAYALIKVSILGLTEEEVAMEIYNLSDDTLNGETEL